MTPPDSGDAKNTNDDDPLGGMDPMAWLESLARRQGANPDELTTAANLDIATPSADTAITGPGYTPGYDTGKSQPVKAVAEPAKPITPAAKQPAPVETPPPAVPTAQPVAAADDPFNGMDMMAWMESLARRQGANPDELTTAANLDIAMPSADTAITGPGYTPGYDTGKPQPGKATPESKPESKPEPAAKQPVPDVTPISAVPVTPPAAEPVASTVAADDPLGGMDPMAWLESLARRQGANPDELTTSANLEIATPSADTAITGPGYTPGYETSKTTPIKPIEGTKIPAPTPLAPIPEPATSAALPPITPPEPETAVPVASTTPAASDDPLHGMDPMAFMESLARRQGVNPNEFTTSANLDIATPPPGTVVDEPGYVEYDPFSVGSTQRAAESSKTPPVPQPPVQEPVASPAGGDDLLGEMDPLAWLESLSMPQSDELTASLTGDTSNVPAATEPEHMQPAEAAMSADEAAQVLGIGSAGQAQPTTDAMASMDPMAWLESLSLGQDTAEFTTFDFSQTPQTAEDYAMVDAASTPTEAEMAPESTLSWLEQLAQGQDESSLPAEDVQPTEAATLTPLEAGGMSNDINEVQRWLDQQAQSLELTRVALEDEGSDELAPAEPGQIPDWLVTSLADTSSSAPVLSSEITPPPTPNDLPPWLAENEVESADLTFDPDFFQLTPALGDEPLPEVAPIGLTSDELAAMTQPTSPEEIDSWAEALDEEYARRQAGDESVPNWYLSALANAEAAPQDVAEPVAAISSSSPSSADSQSYDDFDLPDWLRETPEEAAPALQGELPDWLLSMSREAAVIAPDSTLDQPVDVPTTEPTAELSEPAVVAGDDMDWLNEANLVPSVIPDWLKPAAPPEPIKPEVVPAPAPIEAAKPVEPVAPVVETPKAPEPVRIEAKPVRQIEAVPVADHQARLQQARQLVASAKVPDSLEHYQKLIDSSQLLEETRGDLRQLVDQNPKEPKLRRLLGDTHMRLGDLQAALDTYRSALDQL